MGKVQRFERRLQGMVGDAFARVFGGSVVPQEVAQALQREADDNARPLAGGRVLAPNRYTVTLGVADHDRLAGDEQRVIRMLQDCIRAHLTEQSWDIYGDVVVALERSETLHTGQFRTSSSVDPDASHPRTAGDRAMNQQAGHRPEDDQRRHHGGHGYDQGQGGHRAGQTGGYDYPYAQDQGQNYEDQNYGGNQGGYGSHHQNYGDQGQGGYGYDPANAQSPQAPNQNYGDQNYGQHGYEQGRDNEQGYGQGGYGYDAGYGQGQEAPNQYYGDQNYGQHGGAQPGYGYDQGGYGANQNYGDQNYANQNYGDQNYGAPQSGYPADAGYLPPAGQAGPRPLVASLTLDDGSHRHFPLAEGSNVVGRGQEAQFRLPDTGVSRRHLEITWDGRTATLADLGSTNGTTVNGTPVQTWQLADGDVVRVGHSSLVFRTQD